MQMYAKVNGVANCILFFRSSFSVYKIPIRRVSVVVSVLRGPFLCCYNRPNAFVSPYFMCGNMLPDIPVHGDRANEVLG